MIILASRSPQRRSLLAAAGVVHRVVISDYPEPELPYRAPAALVAAHAAGKADDVVARIGVPPGGAVLGVDTVVVIAGDVLGKPSDRADALDMLRRLSGRRHVVMSAISLVTEVDRHELVDETAVTFRTLDDAQIDWYLAQGEWQGRAGAYAIQGSGASLVVGVDGDFTTVVGLPIARLLTVLDAAGLAPWSASSRQS